MEQAGVGGVKLETLVERSRTGVGTVQSPNVEFKFLFLIGPMCTLHKKLHEQK